MRYPTPQEAFLRPFQSVCCVSVKQPFFRRINPPSNSHQLKHPFIRSRRSFDCYPVQQNVFGKGKHGGAIAQENQFKRSFKPSLIIITMLQLISGVDAAKKAASLRRLMESKPKQSLKGKYLCPSSAEPAFWEYAENTQQQTNKNSRASSKVAPKRSWSVV